MADVEELLQPVSEDDPVGPDLADDADRQMIDLAFEASVSIDPSGAESRAGDVDWRETIALIEAQSAKTKDIWLAVNLARAGARSGQLALVDTGAQYLAGLMERYWDKVHPQLEEYAFQGRRGPCEALANRAGFLAPLERTTLLEHPRLGRFSGVDFVRFKTNAEAEDGYGLFRRALEETPEEVLTGVAERLASITDAVRRVDKTLVDNAGSENTGVQFTATYDTLAGLRGAVLSFTSAAPAADAAADAESEPAQGGGAAAPSGPRIAGSVETRDDVIKALDAICDYYRRREPASPVPSALQRVRDWVNLDFMTLLEDIAPGAVDEAKRVLVSQRKPKSDSSW